MMTRKRRRRTCTDADIPEGRAFLAVCRAQENACDTATAEAIPALGNVAPQTVEVLGTALSLLDRAGSCWWGCRADDHVPEYLVSRAVHLARAGIRLLGFGFYDQALVMARSIGEIANLLLLFLVDRQAFEDWKAATRRERLARYSPMQVRVALEKSRLTKPLIDEERYRLLSEISSHVTPDTRPQAHNPLHRPIGPGYFQEAGLLLSINEIALAMAGVCVGAASLLDLPADKKSWIRDAGRGLAERLGGVSITEMDKMWSSLQSIASEPTDQ